MGRKKNPEQTIEQIIAVSSQLFVEKGYEQTSIQDILDALDLSKGALQCIWKQGKTDWCFWYESIFLPGRWGGDA